MIPAPSQVYSTVWKAAKSRGLDAAGRREEATKARVKCFGCTYFKFKESMETIYFRIHSTSDWNES